MTETDILLILGLGLLLGHALGKVANRVSLPGVVGYLAAGLVLGSSCLNVLSLERADDMGLVSDITLSLVAFAIGCELRLSVLRKMGWGIMSALLGAAFGTAIVVGLLVYVITGDAPLSLILGSVAVASAPAGTVVVLQEYKAKGPLTSALIVVVGLDDGVAIAIYAFAAAVAQALVVGGGEVRLLTIIGAPLWEITKGLMLGAAVGVAFTFVARRIRARVGWLTLSLGAVFLCGGLANTIHASLILASLTLGAMVVNLSPRSSRRIADIHESITHPIYVLFFVLAGAHLEVWRLRDIGVIGLVYVLGRAAGKIAGAYLGAAIGRADSVVRKYLGLGILSQAGVAIGLALMVGRTFTPLGPAGQALAITTINTVAATTIVFEIIGPITAKIAVAGAGEIGQADKRS